MLLAVSIAAACGSDAAVSGKRSREAAAPTAPEWRAIADAPVSFDVGVTSIWTGSALVVWGGLGAGSSGRGAMYTPADDSWQVLPPAPIALRMGHVMIWTGREVVIWGGQTSPMSDVVADGAAYDPAANHWRVLPLPPIEGRTVSAAVWTGTDVVVWGGAPSCCPTDSVIHAPDAIAYDPAANAWRTLADVPEPWSGDDGAAVTAAVAGDLLVWRRDHLGTHAATTDTWSELPAQPALPQRTTASTLGPYAFGAAVGRELFVWVGEWTEPFRGLAYDTSTRTWRRTADLDRDDNDQHPALPTIAASNSAVTAVSVGDNELRIRRYDLHADAWTELPAPPLENRYSASVADTSRGLLVWGGYRPDGRSLSDGALLSPGGVSPSATAAATRVTVALYHCGFKPLDYGGRIWEVAAGDEPFDATNAPSSFVGRGTVSIADDELRYRDDSGIAVRFIPGDGRPDGACA